MITLSSVNLPWYQGSYAKILDSRNVQFNALSKSKPFTPQFFTENNKQLLGRYHQATTIDVATLGSSLL